MDNGTLVIHFKSLTMNKFFALSSALSATNILAKSTGFLKLDISEANLALSLSLPFPH